MAKSAKEIKNKTSSVCRIIGWDSNKQIHKTRTKGKYRSGL